VAEAVLIADLLAQVQEVLEVAVLEVLSPPQQREQSTLDQAEAVLILAVQVVQVALAL
jgi:hypothetical protein